MKANHNGSLTELLSLYIEMSETELLKKTSVLKSYTGIWDRNCWTASRLGSAWCFSPNRIVTLNKGDPDRVRETMDYL